MRNDRVLILKADGKPRMILDMDTQRVFMPLVSNLDDLPKFFHGEEIYHGIHKLDLDQKLWVSVDKVIDYILQEGEGDPELNDVIKAMLKEKNMLLAEWDRKKKEFSIQDTH